MSTKDMLEWIKASPFVPFEFELTTGERFQVRHPEHLLVGKTACYLATYDGDVVERMHHIGLLHIVKVQEMRNARAKKKARKSKDS